MDINERKAVLLKPGDLLVIGNVGAINHETHQGLMVGLSELRESLELAGVVIFEEDVDLATIDAEEVGKLMERQAERRRQRTELKVNLADVGPKICSQGVGGGEVCMRRAGHDGDCDPDSTELHGG